MLKIVKTVTNCKECPQRSYYSGGQYECRSMDGAPLPASCEIPPWCPLQDHPGKLAAIADAKVRNAQAVIRHLRESLESGDGTVEWTKRVLAQLAENLERSA
jgi:hypothetical protein